MKNCHNRLNLQLSHWTQMTLRCSFVNFPNIINISSFIPCSIEELCYVLVQNLFYSSTMRQTSFSWHRNGSRCPSTYYIIRLKESIHLLFYGQWPDLSCNMKDILTDPNNLEYKLICLMSQQWKLSRIASIYNFPNWTDLTWRWSCCSFFKYN